MKPGASLRNYQPTLSIREKTGSAVLPRFDSMIQPEIRLWDDIQSPVRFAVWLTFGVMVRDELWKRLPVGGLG